MVHSEIVWQRRSPILDCTNTYILFGELIFQRQLIISPAVAHCNCTLIFFDFNVQNNSLPFNKYAYLTAHNAYAIKGEPSHTGVPRVTFTNQEDTVTQQLNVIDFFCFFGEQFSTIECTINDLMSVNERGTY